MKHQCHAWNHNFCVLPMQVLMLFQLFDRGEVKALDDPITDYCPSFSMHNPFDDDNVITLR